MRGSLCQDRLEVVEEQVSFDRFLFLSITLRPNSYCWYRMYSNTLKHNMSKKIFYSDNTKCIPFKAIFILVGGKRTEPGEFPHMVSIVYIIFRCFINERK